eukprot:scaffold15168_cov126-Isochrysis_galbana.AAC.3
MQQGRPPFTLPSLTGELLQDGPPDGIGQNSRNSRIDQTPHGTPCGGVSRSGGGRGWLCKLVRSRL